MKDFLKEMLIEPFNEGKSFLMGVIGWVIFIISSGLLIMLFG